MNLNEIDFPAIVANEAKANDFKRQCLDVARATDYRLLSRAEANTKLRKSRRIEYRIVSLNLAHHKTSGHNVCSQASKACAAACVGGDSVGLAQAFPEIMEGRIRKTRMMHENFGQFVRQLVGELYSNQLTAERAGAQLACRMNTFSDIPWEKPAYGMIPQLMPDVQFYDYTKIHSRVAAAPENYHLCGSWSELARHQAACLDLLLTGHNVSIAFSSPGPYAGNRAINQGIPKRHRIGEYIFETFDGDASDLRFLDPPATRSGRGRICALRLKAGTNVGRDTAIDNGFSVHSDCDSPASFHRRAASIVGAARRRDGATARRRDGATARRDIVTGKLWRLWSQLESTPQPSKISKK